MGDSSNTAQSSDSYLTAVFLTSLPFAYLNFSLPVRADELGFDAVLIGGMYAVFTGTMLLVRPVVGYCLDRFGRRRFFVAAFAFYVLAMAVFASGQTLEGFYVARFLQGIGASLMWVSVRTIIADLHAPADRGEAMGKLTTTSVRGSMLGAFYGFTLAGMMPAAEAWVWAFGGYAVTSLGALIWSAFKVGETGGVSESRPPIVWSRGLQQIFVVVFLSAFASALIEPIYLIYLKNRFEVGTYLLALTFLPSGLVFAILPRYAGRWSDRLGRGRVIAVGIAFAGLVSLALPFWPMLLLVGVSYILFSVGWALASPAEDALVADLAPAAVRGSVLGAKEAAAGVGAALGPLAGGYIYENWAQEMAFVVNGCLLLVTSGLALIWFRR